ncbi:MAG TPA: hypothetical protein VFV10_18245 [Gammaproteobacteria bacterium]|nr:hypothetical protein [Gammaproteobacteria bacterium]
MTGIILAIVVAAAAAAIFVYFRVARSRRAERPGFAAGPAKMAAGAAKMAAGEGFASVELRAGSPACRAARSMAGKIYLISEAPVLPLARCDVARCRCAFEKRTDRRAESRRWEDVGVQPTIVSAVNRRGGSDRRRPGKSKT